jgi:signal transduction histidine kinase
VRQYRLHETTLRRTIPTQSDERGEDEDMSNSQARLFVIDDDAASRSAVQALAVTMNIECELFASAGEFLDRHDSSLTGCALIDWHLDGMDGLQLAERLHALGSPLGVVLVSADADVPMTVRAMKAGALGVLEKPYLADDLADLIQEAVSAPAARQSSPDRADQYGHRFLAHDLHDGVAQYLAMAMTFLEECRSALEANGQRPQTAFGNAMNLLKRSMSELRNLICGTHAATNAKDVEGVLKHAIAEYHDRLEIELVQAPGTTHLDIQLACALYCIIHELLANVWRHSGSRRARIAVRQDDGQLRVEVRDWGMGFDPANVAKGRFGLQGVRDRARLFGGWAAVKSARGEGACVSVSLPVVSPTLASADAADPERVHGGTCHSRRTAPATLVAGP